MLNFIANQFMSCPELPQNASFNIGLNSSAPHLIATTSLILSRVASMKAILAMTDHQLGRDDEARAELAIASK